MIADGPATDASGGHFAPFPVGSTWAGDTAAQRLRLSPHIRDNLPKTTGHSWSYYLWEKGALQMMVVVDAEPGERIEIADQLDLIVLAVENDQIRLAIDDRPKK